MILLMSVGYIVIAIMAMTIPVLILRPAARVVMVRPLDYLRWFLMVACIGAGCLAIFQFMFWPAITSQLGAR